MAGHPFRATGVAFLVEGLGCRARDFLVEGQVAFPAAVRQCRLNRGHAVSQPVYRDMVLQLDEIRGERLETIGAAPAGERGKDAVLADIGPDID